MPLSEMELQMNGVGGLIEVSCSLWLEAIYSKWDMVAVMQLNLLINMIVTILIFIIHNIRPVLHHFSASTGY